jgi:transposase
VIVLTVIRKATSPRDGVTVESTVWYVKRNVALDRIPRLLTIVDI